MSDKAVNALHVACLAGDASTVKQLFKTTPLDSSDATKEFKSPQISVDVIRLLLGHGADVNEFRAPNGKLRVWTLDDSSTLEMFKLYAEHGFDFQQAGHELLEDFVHSREILDWLLDQGADINKPTKRSSLGGRLTREDYDLTLGVLNNAAALGDIQLFDYLISRGADVSHCIALHHVTRCTDPEKTRSMISHLIDKCQFDVDGTDNIHGLRNICDLNDKAYRGTPLTLAILHDNFIAAEEFLKRGADPNGDKSNPNLMAAIGTYSSPPHFSCLKPLLEAGANASYGLALACKRFETWSEDKSCLDAARLCLEYGADPFGPERDKALEIEDLIEIGCTKEEIDRNVMQQEMKGLLHEWQKKGQPIAG